MRKKLSLVRSLTHFTRTEVENLFKSAKSRHYLTGLEIRCTPPTNNSIGRLLIIASRASGNAVERNLIRRRLKHIFYQERLFQNGRSCIVVVKKEAHALSYDDLKNILVTCLPAKAS